VSFLLDTNVISELQKKERNEHVIAWLASADPGDLYLSVLVLGEARYGIELRRRRDPKHAAALERWYNKLVAEHAGRILGVDMRIAELWGHVRAPRPLPAIDSLLAATALTHDLTLVTRNVRQLEGTGVRVLNPFEPV
jgi:predicted nucleic acid-binding protein